MVVLSCFLFIRSGQNHLARHSERGRKTRQIKEEEVGNNIREWTGLEFVTEGSGEQRKMEETGCEVIYGALTALTR